MGRQRNGSTARRRLKDGGVEEFLASVGIVVRTEDGDLPMVEVTSPERLLQVRVYIFPATSSFISLVTNQ